MAEFEELRLTVNLVDTASAGLQKVRSEIGQLTGSAQAMTTSMVQASAGLSSFATGAQNAQPKLRTLNTELRDMQRHAADTGRALGQMGIAAQQGFAGLPQIAIGLYDAVGGVKGLGEAMKNVAPVARISTQALVGIGIGIAAVGAAVVAYGISVFRMAKETDQLNRTAKTLGMSFGDLKNAQDQAKSFGISADAMIRTFQGVQSAQLDLYNNNSQLRQKLVTKGVDADFVDALGVMDPTDFTNAVVKYAKSLEQQWLASGAIPSVARAEANKFLKEFGVAINLMDMPELKKPTASAKREAARLAKLSQDVMDIWNPLTVKLDMIKLEALKAGLPYLASVLENSDQIIDSIGRGIDAIGTELANIVATYQAFTKPAEHQGWWADALFGKRGESSLRDALEWMAAKRGNPSPDYYSDEVTTKPGATEPTIFNRPPEMQPGTSAPALPPELAGPSRLSPAGAKSSIQDRFKAFGKSSSVEGEGGAQRYGLLTQEATDQTEINTDQMAKLTDQVERLNNYYERLETERLKKGAGGGTGTAATGGASGSGTGGGTGAGSGSGADGNGSGGTGGGGGGGDSAQPSGGGSSVSKADAQAIFGGGKIAPPDNAVPASADGKGGGYPSSLLSARGAGGGAGLATSMASQPQPGGEQPGGGGGGGGGGGDAMAAQAAQLLKSQNERLGGGGDQPASFNERWGGSSAAMPRLGPRPPIIPAIDIAEFPEKRPRTAAEMSRFGSRPFRIPAIQKPEFPDKTSYPMAGGIGGDYPTSLFSARGSGGGIGLDASMGSRSDLDRDALAKADRLDIDANAKVKVQVGGATASDRISGGHDMFRNSTMQTMDQMPHTSTGGSSVDEVAKQYMASR
jgi:transposase-like protein